MKGPSGKNHESKKRLGKAINISLDIEVDNSKPAFVDQQAFHSNESNKSSFIQLLTKNVIFREPMELKRLQKKLSDSI